MNRKTIGILAVILATVLAVTGFFAYQSSQTLPTPTLTQTLAPIQTPSPSPITTQTPTITPASLGMGELKVYIFDLGGGDSILFVTSNHKTMLVDGGECADGRRVVDLLRSLGIERLDVVVGTHPHSDHICGLIEVFNTMPVGTIIDSGQENRQARFFEDYKAAINRLGFTVGRASQTINLDPSVKIDILSPPEPLFTGGEALSANSIVLEVSHGSVNFLFPADAEPNTEEFLSTQNGDVEVLVASHHGSGESNTLRFLQTTSPEAVIVIYSHRIGGLEDTLARLATVDAQVYRTDQHGTITITSSGSSYAITPSRFTTPVPTTPLPASPTLSPTPSSTPFDFSLSVSPSSRTVAAGDSATFTVTAELLSGTTQTISFSLSGLSSIVGSASFSPVGGSPTFSSTLTVATSGSAPADTYTFTVLGTTGGTIRTATLTLTVTQPAPSPSPSPSPSPTSRPQTFTILINEVELNPPGTDSGYEWLELYNPNSVAVDISGWTLSTTAGRIGTVTIASGTTIGPNGFYVVSRSTQWLDNEGDSIILFDSSDNIVASTPILDDTANDNRSWQRKPAGSDNWQFGMATRGTGN